jgi:hypothetical protein
MKYMYDKWCNNVMLMLYCTNVDAPDAHFDKLIWIQIDDYTIQMKNYTIQMESIEYKWKVYCRIQIENYILQMENYRIQMENYKIQMEKIKICNAWHAIKIQEFTGLFKQNFYELSNLQTKRKRMLVLGRNFETVL